MRFISYITITDTPHTNIGSSGGGTATVGGTSDDGSLSLLTSSNPSSDTTTNGEGGFPFEMLVHVNGGERIFEFMADTKHLRDRWVSAISKSKDKINEIGGPNPGGFFIAGGGNNETKKNKNNKTGGFWKSDNVLQGAAADYAEEQDLGPVDSIYRGTTLKDPTSQRRNSQGTLLIGSSSTSSTSSSSERSSTSVSYSIRHSLSGRKKPLPFLFDQTLNHDRGALLLSGELKKKSPRKATFRPWQARHFDLYEKILVYYKDNLDGKPTGGIELQYMVAAYRIQTQQRFIIVLDLEAGGRTFEFEASNPEICRKWVETLRNQITLIQSGIDFSGKKSKQNTSRPILQSILKKQATGGLKRWQVRFFQLYANSLLYYRSRTPIGQPGEAINLELILTINTVLDNGTRFELVLSGSFPNSSTPPVSSSTSTPSSSSSGSPSSGFSPPPGTFSPIGHRPSRVYEVATKWPPPSSVSSPLTPTSQNNSPWARKSPQITPLRVRTFPFSSPSSASTASPVSAPGNQSISSASSASPSHSSSSSSSFSASHSSSQIVSTTSFAIPSSPSFYGPDGPSTSMLSSRQSVAATISTPLNGRKILLEANDEAQKLKWIGLLRRYVLVKKCLETDVKLPLTGEEDSTTYPHTREGESNPPLVQSANTYAPGHDLRTPRHQSIPIFPHYGTPAKRPSLPQNSFASPPPHNSPFLSIPRPSISIANSVSLNSITASPVPYSSASSASSALPESSSFDSQISPESFLNVPVPVTPTSSSGPSKSFSSFDGKEREEREAAQSTPLSLDTTLVSNSDFGPQTPREGEEISPFSLPDSRDVIVYDENVRTGASDIKYATLDKLIQWITHELYEDLNSKFVFLLTYTSFVNSRDLLEKLAHRFRATPSSEFEGKSGSTQALVQLKVCAFLYAWIKCSYQDFMVDSILLLRFRELFRQMSLWSVSGKVTQAIGVVEMFLEKQKTTPSPGLVSVLIPQGPPPKTNFSTEIKHLELELIPPLEAARQLTLIDFELLSRITPTECLRTKWEKSDKELQAPNIVRMTHQWNQISAWVQVRVMECKDPALMARRFTWFIQVAQGCRSLNNFSSYCAIYSALMEDALNRLNKFRTLLQPKHERTLGEYEILTDKSQQNHRALRKCLEESNLPCIPYMGLLLGDLAFIDLGNKDIAPDGRLINFYKYRLLAERISQIMYYQSVSYNLQVIPSLRDFLNHELVSVYQTIEKDTLWEMSIAIEPL